ncbi:PREDICTED: uncharacterized protein LOC109335307 [Lupinus angustifolius]|uniref:uncharacterized protein LOC109335307 n=1 Tax=Lupinus angustifolius TaxID=3871 RepID=UPI00092F6CCF|nr:PREDICTED: uncharacterized protein LOC109335307 [Lupinus angustifolius]
MANQVNSFDPHINPYFLSANENPALILVTPLLNGNNYQSWSRSMKLALESKNKLDFISRGMPQPPPNDPLHGSWKRFNTMILSWIQHSIEESIVKSILWMNDASDVWKDQQERFSQSDIFRIAQLIKEFYHLS